MRLERLDMQEELTLVVDGSARKNLSVADGWLKRGRCPQIERLRRLDIVVAVDQNRWRARRISPLTDHYRMTGGRIDLRRDSNLVERSLHPFSSPLRISVVLGLRAYTRNSEEVE